MAKRITKYCPRCQRKSEHETRLTEGKPVWVCLNCELLEQQVREGERPGKSGKNTSATTDPKDVYENLRSWGGPFGGGLAGGG
jgi:hypothetical protein